MKKITISMILLTAIGTLGAFNSVAIAQGGVMLPEPVVAPVPVAVPRSSPVVEYTYRSADTAGKKMPLPIKHPIAATGRITHYQDLSQQSNKEQSKNIGAAIPAQNSLTVAPMGMGMYNAGRASARIVPVVSH